MNKKKLKFNKMKKIASLFLVMIFVMSSMAQKTDTVITKKVDTTISKASTDTAVFERKTKKQLKERRKQAEKRREQAQKRRRKRRIDTTIVYEMDTTFVDSLGNNTHIKMKGKEVIIIQGKDGTTRINVSKDKNKKVVTLHVDSDSDYNYNYGDSDTTRIRIGKKKFIIIDDDNNNQIFFENEDFDKPHKFKGHFSGVDIGINNYFTSDFSTSLPANEEYMNLNTGKSWGININFLQQNIGLVNNNIGLVTGLGLEFNNYRFDNNQLVLSGDSTVLYAYTETQRNYEKNKLVTTYLTVPIMMEFQVPVGEKKKPVYLSVGATGSVKLGSHIKLKDNSGHKEKNRDDYNLSPLRYGLTARIGYRCLNFFANYSLQPMFEKDKGPELYPFTIGISLVDF